MKSRRDLLKFGVASALIAALPKANLCNIYLLKTDQVVDTYWEVVKTGKKTKRKNAVVKVEDDVYWLPLIKDNLTINAIQKFDNDCLTYNGYRNKYITVIITPHGHSIFGSETQVNGSKLLV